MIRLNRLASVLLLTFIMATSGCQLMTGARLAAIPTASPEHPVVEIICVWQPGEGTGLDGLPARGFAGQLLFFSMGQTTPVKVRGKVRVYVFDDQGTEEEQVQPIHQFDFDANSFQSFLTQTNMGAAYQLFIPYTRKGNHNTSCTLRVRYTPEEGNAVYSKMATVVLPGISQRQPDKPIEVASTASTSSDPHLVATLLSNLADGRGIEQASATTYTPTTPSVTAELANSDDKRRLRSRLTEISQIAPETAKAEASAPGVTPPQDHPEPTRLKLHPLAASGIPAEPAKVSPPAETAVPAAAESSAATTESPATDKSAAEATPPAEPPQASHHPLADD